MKIDVEELEDLITRTAQLHPQVEDFLKEWDYLPTSNVREWAKDEQRDAMEFCEVISARIRLGQNFPYSEEQLDALSLKEIHHLMEMVGLPKSRLGDKTPAGRKAAILSRQEHFDLDVWITGWLNTERFHP